MDNSNSNSRRRSLKSCTNPSSFVSQIDAKITFARSLFFTYVSQTFEHILMSSAVCSASDFKRSLIIMPSGPISLSFSTSLRLRDISQAPRVERHHAPEQYTHHILHRIIECNNLLFVVATLHLKGINSLESQDDNCVLGQFARKYIVRLTHHQQKDAISLLHLAP